MLTHVLSEFTLQAYFDLLFFANTRQGKECPFVSVCSED